MTLVDLFALETRVREMYRRVAEEPEGAYHFEMGRPLAERLGYPAGLLDRVPVGAVNSFAGVGYFFDLADLAMGERVVDLGSGSGMDTFIAALLVGEPGHVVGIDFTPEQLAKSRRLATEGGLDRVVEFKERRIESLPIADSTIDCAISNGVINLAPDKGAVFAEAARVLRHGGRLAVADIVTERALTDRIVADPDLWASCIGGAAQEDDYRAALESVGLDVQEVKVNPYEFLSNRARDASARYGVKSVSIRAVKG